MLSYQSELLDLALEVVRKVVDRELRAATRALARADPRRRQRALDRDHPDPRRRAAVRLLRTHLAELRAELDASDFEPLEDPALPATGGVLGSHYGDRDLGVDGQMSAIRAALTGADVS
jgi:flagellar biosynthesis/type III secretory pathway protein FliH